MTGNFHLHRLILATLLLTVCFSTTTTRASKSKDVEDILERRKNPRTFLRKSLDDALPFQQDLQFSKNRKSLYSVLKQSSQVVLEKPILSGVSLQHTQPLPSSHSSITGIPSHLSPFQSWIKHQRLYALDQISNAIQPNGAVWASPTMTEDKPNPNYRYHWVRDAALTMLTLSHLTESAARDNHYIEAKHWGTLLDKFATFTYNQQQTQFPEHSPIHNNGMMREELWLAEPKWEANGQIFQQGWGRPQNDGPALRAITLSRYFKLLLRHPKLLQDMAWSHFDPSGEQRKSLKQTESLELYTWKYVEEYKSLLYSAKLPATSIIKRDLEFCAHQWNTKSFDIWEEVYAEHLYTLLVQRRALIEGAELATLVHDKGAAVYYYKIAQAIEEKVKEFWVNDDLPGTGYFRAWINIPNDHSSHRHSGLDTQVILASLHTARGQKPFLSPHDDTILATAYRLIRDFEQRYPINHANSPKYAGMWPAIGRYPEDRYNGESDTMGGIGNPWAITTAAMAELCARVGTTFKNAKAFAINDMNRPFIEYVLTKYLSSFESTPFRMLHKGIEGELLKDIKHTQGLVKQGDLMFDAVIHALQGAALGWLRRIQAHVEPDGGRMDEQWYLKNGRQMGAQHLTWSYTSFIEALHATLNLDH